MDCNLHCAVVVYVVVVSGVCMCACRRMGMLYIALCSGADVKYINVSNVHRLQCIYIHAGNELAKCPFCYFNVMQSSSIYIIL